MSTIVIQGKTDVGCVRTNNEDNYLVTDNILKDQWSSIDDAVPMDQYGAVLIVADGMGGEVAGELASELAVNSIRDYFKKHYLDLTDESKIIDHMNNALVQAHHAITTYVKNHAEYYGMGTTATINFIKNDKLYISWVGDSRTYRYSKAGRITAHDYYVRDLEILTNDHSQVWMSVLSGNMTPEEARVAPNSNVITQSLGDIYRLPAPEHRVFDLYEGDLILSCSDGLNGMFSDDKLETIVAKHFDSLNLKEELISSAREHGGEDNITVALCRVVSGNPYSIADDITEDIVGVSAKAQAVPAANSSVPVPAIKKSSGIVPFLLGLSTVAAIFLAYKVFTDTNSGPENNDPINSSMINIEDDLFAEGKDTSLKFDGIISRPDTVASLSLIHI